VPQLINYQALLIDPATGDPIADDTYEMVFSIYDVETGGTAIWTETKNVDTQNGLYVVMLGSTTPLTSAILSGAEKYLGIKVGTDPEMTPRKRIVSVAYAIVSEEADKLDGKEAAEFADAVHSHDDRYYTETEMSTSDGDPPNKGSNLVSWNNLNDVPAGFADGTDNEGAGGGNTLDQAYDQGGAGAGRAITADAGAFEVGGTDGVLFSGTYESGSIPVEGEGTRMMWYPKKAAFRVGKANGTEWDDSNVGLCSVATGEQTRATGDISTALGYNTAATASYSTAMGVLSHAEGFASTAMGYQAMAAGSNSTAMGMVTDANGNTSVAMGYSTDADAYCSVALGRYNVGGGTPDSWIATDPLFEIGIGSTVANHVNALTVLKNGKVGIGENAPTTLLHISRDAPDDPGTHPNTMMIIEDGNSSAYLQIMAPASSTRALLFGETGAGGQTNDGQIGYEDVNGMRFWVDRGGSEKIPLRLEVDGDVRLGNNTVFVDYSESRVGIGTTNPQGTLDVNGAIYQYGSVLHSDYVFEPDYKLESIDEHSDYMWQNKHLMAIPKAEVNEEGLEVVEVGSHRRGIVEELEKAHIYIEQLHKRLKLLEEKLASLELEHNVR
jgi:hypothetical protein